MNNVTIHRDMKDWIKATMVVPFGGSQPSSQPIAEPEIQTHDTQNFPIPNTIPPFWRESLDPEVLAIPNPTFLFQTLLHNDDPETAFPSKELLYQTFFPAETRFQKAARTPFQNVSSSIETPVLLELLDIVHTLNEPFICESNPALGELCKDLAKKGDLSFEDEEKLIMAMKGNYLELDSLKTLAQLSTHLSVLGKTSSVQRIEHLFSQLYTNNLGVMLGQVQNYTERNEHINFAVISASTLSIVSGLGSPIITLMSFISNTLHIPPEMLYGNPLLFLAAAFATSLAVIVPLKMGARWLNTKLTNLLDTSFHHSIKDSDKANFINGIEHFWNDVHKHEAEILSNNSSAIHLDDFTRLAEQPGLSETDTAALKQCIALLSQKGSRSALAISEHLSSPYVFALMRMADNTFGNIPAIANITNIQSNLLATANTKEEQKAVDNFIKKLTALQSDSQNHSMTEIFWELGNLPKTCLDVLKDIDGFKQLFEIEINIPSGFSIYEAITNQQKELLKNERYLNSSIKKIQPSALLSLLNDPEFSSDLEKVKTLANKIEQLQKTSPHATFAEIASDLQQFTSGQLGKIFDLRGFEIFQIVGKVFPKDDLLAFQDVVLDAVENPRVPAKLLSSIRLMSHQTQEQVEKILPQLHLYEPYLFSKKINIQELKQKLLTFPSNTPEHKQLSKIIDILSSLPNPENKTEFSGQELREFWSDEQIGNYFACLTFLFGIHPLLADNFMLHQIESERNPSLLEKILLVSGAFGTGIVSTNILNKLFLHSPTQLFRLQPFGFAFESVPFYLTLGLFLYQAGNIGEKIAEISSSVKNRNYQKGFSHGISQIFEAEPKQNIFHQLKEKLFGNNYKNHSFAEFSRIRRASFDQNNIDAEKMWSDWLQSFDTTDKPISVSQTA